jgi:hypothetical protein
MDSHFSVIPAVFSPRAFHDYDVTDVKRGLGPTLFNENGRHAHLECPASTRPKMD